MQKWRKIPQSGRRSELSIRLSLLALTLPFLALSEENFPLKWPTRQILPLCSGLCGPLRGCTESRFKARKRAHLPARFLERKLGMVLAPH